MSSIYMVNLTSVGIFGMVLSAFFCDIRWTRKKVMFMTGSIMAILLLQGIIYFFVDADIVENIYPFITHFPLAIVLFVLSRQCLWSIISVLTAYLCCQIRRWMALLIVAVFSGGAMMQDVAELTMTLPILLVLVRFIAPSVRSISHHPTAAQCWFGVVPAVYYGFDYLTRIYTSLLSDGVLAAVEFMPFVCSMAYLIFTVQTSREEQIRHRLEQTQDIINLQIAQAVREVKSLRELQHKTSTFRHDLRHHMQYLSSCMENGKIDQAQAYIQEICSEIEANRVTVYCENETVNLIFSSFAGRAEDNGIPINIKAAISQFLPISETDLCVLLSNALENALHACQKLRDKDLPGTIEVSAYEKSGKFFLQVINSCDDDITFEYGVPVTKNPGHGIGVRSICTIVEKYGGIYTFFVKDGRFFLRVSF
ncbi:MAG: GHKL domain-containing protein [Acetatifactor sp.]|nr:GHKL domain-containing protein [Acetatifactor sp.]